MTFELAYEPDPLIWLVGPTEARPLDLWMPGATQAIVDDFGIDDEQGRKYVEAVLRRFAVDDSVPLTEKLLRWRSIDDDPFAVHLGVVERDHWSPGDVDAFVGFESEELVEPAMVEVVDGVTAESVRRGIGYSQGQNRLVTGVRYVIDDGDPDLLAMMMTATSRPGQLIEALDDFDDFARTVHLVRPAA